MVEERHRARFRRIVEVIRVKLDHLSLGALTCGLALGLLGTGSTCSTMAPSRLIRAAVEKLRKWAPRRKILEQPPVGVEHRLAAVEIGSGELRLLQQPAALVLVKQIRRLGRAHDEAMHIAHKCRIEHFIECHGTNDGHTRVGTAAMTAKSATMRIAGQRRRFLRAGDKSAAAFRKR